MHASQVTILLPVNGALFFKPCHVTKKDLCQPHKFVMEIKCEDINKSSIQICFLVIINPNIINAWIFLVNLIQFNEFDPCLLKVMLNR